MINIKDYETEGNFKHIHRYISLHLKSLDCYEPFTVIDLGLTTVTSIYENNLVWIGLKYENQNIEESIPSYYTYSEFYTMINGKYPEYSIGKKLTFSEIMAL